MSECPVHPGEKRHPRFDEIQFYIERGWGWVPSTRIEKEIEQNGGKLPDQLPYGYAVTEVAEVAEEGSPQDKWRGNATLNFETAEKIRALTKTGDKSYAAIAQQFGVSRPTVCAIAQGRRWMPDPKKPGRPKQMQAGAGQ